MTAFRVATWNIAGGQNTGDHAFANRVDPVFRRLVGLNSDLIGLQEVQLENLDMFMRKGIREASRLAFHPGLDEGNGAMPGTIARKADRFWCESQECLWLNPNTAQMEKGWDANLPRCVCGYQMEDLQDPLQEVWIYNTHLDHIGVESRYESIRMILELLEWHRPEVSVIITGDFNFNNDEQSFYDMFVQAGFTDAWRSTHQGISMSTLHRYPEDEHKGPGSKSYVDIIWVKNLRVLSAEIIDVRTRPIFESDHQIVVAEVDYLA